MISNRKKRLTIVLASGIPLLGFMASAHAFSFKVSDTDVGIYGYAKLDMIYDVDSRLGNLVSNKNTRLDDLNGADGHFIAHAEESRIGFTTSTEVSGDKLKTKIEGDFWGGTLRLRHAYGEWNGILAGQTWMNFYGFVSGTPTIDFGAVGGKPRGNRQAQIRYTSNRLSVALEDPDDKGKLPDDADAKAQLPDITVRYTDKSGAFKYSVSGLGRYLGIDDGSDRNDEAIGWGVGLEASIDMNNWLTVRAGLTHGEGVGGYMSRPLGEAAYVDANNEVQLVTTTGYTLGMSWKAGAGTFNAAYSRSAAKDLDDNPEYVGNGTVANPGEDKEYEGFWLNYIWSPAKKVSYGVEVSRHTRETVGGFEGDAVRLQAMAKYSF